MDARPLLQLRSVSKTFASRNWKGWIGLEPSQKVLGLADVSLELRGGEIAGLLGPNGAGKTTLINVICDLVRVDAGSVMVEGRRVPDSTGGVLRQIGLLNSNERSFSWRLTGRQNLEFFAALHALPRRRALSRVDELLTCVGLESAGNRRFMTYSTGMRKRLALARALLHEPKLLLMDEATNGLDAGAAAELLEMVRTRLAATGHGVLWATHRLDEVLTVCDRVIVLLDGRIRFDGTVEQFRKTCTEQSCHHIDLQASGEPRAQLEAFARSIGAEIEFTESSTRITLRRIGPGQTASDVLSQLIERGSVIERFEPVPISLHEVFINLAGESD